MKITKDSIYTARKIIEDLIDQGFSIDQRHKLIKKIGKAEYLKLKEIYSKAYQNNYILQLSGESRPTNIWCRMDNHLNNTELTVYSQISYAKERKLIFNDEEITAKNIQKQLQKHRQEIEQYYYNAKPLPSNALDSNKAFNTFLSFPKFKVPQGKNKDGYFVTTVIDKKTGEPVHAYVKLINKDKNKNGWEEGWEFFVKNKNGEYESIGLRYFNVDKKEKAITSRWMDSRGGNDRFAGIGVRAHQITIERMRQLGFDKVKIESLPWAYPFHKSCGFKAMPEKGFNWTDEHFKEYIGYGFSREEICNILDIPLTTKGKVLISQSKIDNLKKALYLKNNGNIDNYNLNMILEGTSLENWDRLIDVQPILNKPNWIARIKLWLNS